MASKISTLSLLEHVLQYITTDANDSVLKLLVKQAIIDADRALRECDEFSPLAWDIVEVDGLRTCYGADISAITQANPGVITAACRNSSIDGHGFHNARTYFHQDIVIIDDVDGMEELNRRAYLLQYIDDDTFYLRDLETGTPINTTNYTEYSSGGVVYHAGFLLSATAILANVTKSAWTIKRLINSPRFDGISTSPISENEINDQPGWIDVSFASRPQRYKAHQCYSAAGGNAAHLLRWYPVADQPYNLSFSYQKEIPDISKWDNATYPFHPAECHDALWKGALAGLAGLAQRMKRESEKTIATQLEVLFANKWAGEWDQAKSRTRRLSRHMLGARGGMGRLTT